MVEVAQPLRTVGKFKVVIFDPHPAAREGLESRLQSNLFEVCGSTGSASEAMQLLVTTSPQVVVMEIALRRGSGIELLKRILDTHTSVSVLVWSRYREKIFAERAIRHGAMGYIEKDQPTSAVVDAVKHVAIGKMYLSPDMTEAMLQATVGKANELYSDPIAALSDRELDVFRMIGMSHDTERIARELHLSQKTVETYRARIKAKLGADSSSELLRLAVHWELANG